MASTSALGEVVLPDMSKKLVEEEEVKVPGPSASAGPSKTILRMKRRLDESPAKVLVMSYKRAKHEGEGLGAAAGGEEINRVFHLVGTIEKDKDHEESIANTIKEALDVVEKQRRLPVKRATSFRERTVKLKGKEDEAKQHAGDSRFKVICQKRGISSSVEEKENAEAGMFFNLLDLVAEEDTGSPEKKARKRSPKDQEIGSVTVNGVSMIKENISGDLVSEPKTGDLEKIVFDLYLAKDSSSSCDEGIYDQFVSVRDGTEDHEFDYVNDNVSSDEDCRPDDEDDSNDEENYRNDYPDSDPDREDGFAYGYDDDGLAGHFSAIHIGGNDLSSTDDDDDIYTGEGNELDLGLGAKYKRYKAKMQQELADEVQSSASESD